MTSPFKGSGPSAQRYGNQGQYASQEELNDANAASRAEARRDRAAAGGISLPVSAPPRTNSGALPGTPTGSVVPGPGFDINFGAQPRQEGTTLPAGITAKDDAASRDAYAMLQSVLATYGLESLGPTVQQWLVQGLSEAEILQRMRETPQFKTRFPAIEARQKAGLAPLSPGEYVAYEQQARQMMRAAGLPSGFYDGNDDFTRFLTNDLSLSELSDRVTLATSAAFQMPQADRDALTEFGMGPGDITAFWLDPDKAQPLLERKYAAAQLAGASFQSGYGKLNETEATGLAQQGIGREQGLAGFSELTGQRELFGALDSGEDAIGRQDQLDAAFGGNATQRRRIEQRARRRAAQFQGGGGFAASQEGLVGLGDA